MAQARKALGGEQKLAAVKALSLRATYQREMSLPGMTGGGRAVVMMDGGGGPADGRQLADHRRDRARRRAAGKYIKVDTSTGFMAMTRTEGFEGERPFAHAAAANPGMRIQIDRPGDDPARAKQALQRNQAELARLLLGILGSTQSSFPVTYAHAGIAESADGKADMIDVKGPENFAVAAVPRRADAPAADAHLHGARTAHRHEHGRSRQPGRGAERERLEEERRQAEAAPPKLVEYRLFFSDYRDVGSLSLPHRIARGTAAEDDRRVGDQELQDQPGAQGRPLQGLVAAMRSCSSSLAVLASPRAAPRPLPRRPAPATLRIVVVDPTGAVIVGAQVSRRSRSRARANRLGRSRTSAARRCSRRCRTAATRSPPSPPASSRNSWSSSGCAATRDAR